jgi:hypothetical protein
MCSECGHLHKHDYQFNTHRKQVHVGDEEVTFQVCFPV